MRAYNWYLLFTVVWSFFAAQAAILHTLNVGFASVSGFGGFLAGTIAARSTIQGIEKKGEYRQSRNRLLLGLGLALVINGVWVYGIISGAIPMLPIFSVYAALPAVYLAGVVNFRRWELKNGKEIHSEGFWVGTFYAIPKGLTWQEQYQYRYEQRERLRARNSAGGAATNKPHSD